MINKYTTDRDFLKFCKAMHKDSEQAATPFNVWKQKHISDLIAAYEIIIQDTKIHLVNSLKK
jgi:hypothetical protein